MTRAKYADKDERELAQSIETEEWASDLPKRDKKRYEEYAQTALTKQKRVNIPMTERDLKRIQAKAIEEGVPYQHLISMLIHKIQRRRNLHSAAAQQRHKASGQ